MNTQKVIIITEEQANSMMGVEYVKDMKFNPIQDMDGNWVISYEEAMHCKKTEYAYLKTMPKQKHKPKPVEDEKMKLKGK